MSNINMSALITAKEKQDATRLNALTQLAALRWQYETAGLTLPDGRHVQTGRDNQAQIANTVAGIQAGLIADLIPWKTPHGWIELTPAELLELAVQVSHHVQKCFAAERMVSMELSASDAPAQVDLAARFQASLMSMAEVS